MGASDQIDPSVDRRHAAVVCCIPFSRRDGGEISLILGYSSNAFKKHSIYEAVEEIGRLGFRGIEIMCKRPHVHASDFGEAEWPRLKSCVEAKNLKVINLNCSTLFAVGNGHPPAQEGPPEEDVEDRIAHTKQSLRLASYLGCRNISIPTGTPPQNLTREEFKDLFRQRLQKVLPLAEELDVDVLVEPEPGLLGDNLGHFKAFIEEVRSPALGVNFDIGHFYCLGEDPSAAFEQMFPWVGHVHLDDIARSRIHNHLIPGRGVIDFLEIFKAMARLGYDRDICLELYTYLDTPVEAGEESLTYILPVFEEAGLELEGQVDTIKGSGVGGQGSGPDA
jgi:sugar phosphate isomerase/epimerase